jgi:NADH-quinone oxidoreductase subunit L
MAALANRLGFDELYAATVGRLNTATAALAAFLDRYVIGGLVTFLAQLGIFSGSVNRQMDEANLNGGFDAVSESVRETGLFYSRKQTGETHGYLRVVAVAFVLLFLVLALGGVR